MPTDWPFGQIRHCPHYPSLHPTPYLSLDRPQFRGNFMVETGNCQQNSTRLWDCWMRDICPLIYSLSLSLDFPGTWPKGISEIHIQAKTKYNWYFSPNLSVNQNFKIKLKSQTKIFREIFPKVPHLQPIAKLSACLDAVLFRLFKWHSPHHRVRSLPLSPASPAFDQPTWNLRIFPLFIQNHVKFEGLHGANSCANPLEIILIQNGQIIFTTKSSKSQLADVPAFASTSSWIAPISD